MTKICLVEEKGALVLARQVQSRGSALHWDPLSEIEAHWVRSESNPHRIHIESSTGLVGTSVNQWARPLFLLSISSDQRRRCWVHGMEWCVFVTRSTVLHFCSNRLFVLFSSRNPIISETLQTRVGPPDEESFITLVFSFEINLAAQLDACINCVGYRGYTIPRLW